jgi:uncharacterized membrane protein
MAVCGLLAAAAIAVVLIGASWIGAVGGALVCPTGGCETVQSSSYAELLGVPVAAVGLVGFLAILGAALARGEWGG